MRTALQHNHNIRLTGGTEGVRYNASVSYYNQDGILLNSGYERFQARANTVIKRDKLDINLTIIILVVFRLVVHHLKLLIVV